MADTDDVFRALADPSRRTLLDRLNERNGQTLRELCAGLGHTRQSVSKHLAVLAAAGLVTTMRRGREKVHHLDAAPINAIADRWLSRYDRHRARVLADLTRALEQPPVTDNPFVYTTYVRTTPERLWRALTEPAFTREYWGVAFTTDWRPGAPMTWDYRGVTMVDPEQVVLAADPYRRLAYTWHGITPEFAALIELDEAERARLAAEPRTRVSFDLEPVPDDDDLVKLTVVHDGFGPGSTLREGLSQGWPRIVADLKSLLERRPVPTP